MTALSVDTRKHLPDIALKIFKRAFRDWNEMFGFDAEALDSKVRVLNSSQVLLRRILGDGVLVRTQAEGKTSGWAAFVFPNDFVGVAVATAMMMPLGDEPSVDPENSAHAETAQELMNLFCGSASRALEDSHHRLRISQSVDHLRVDLAAKPPEEIVDGSSIVCLHVDVQVGERNGRAWCLLPAEVAATSL